MQNQSDQNIKKFKIVFLGDETVGKTSIISKYAFDKIPQTYDPTIGIDFMLKKVNLDGQIIKLQIWDTAGSERFRSLIPTYIRDSKAAVLCYDVENFSSFQNIQTWLDYIKNDGQLDILTILVANKIDVSQNRAVPEDQGISFAINNNMVYYECSAKEGTNITRIFEDITIKLLVAPQKQLSPKPENVQTTSVEQNTKFKIVFLGDQGVGKSSIISKFVLNEVSVNYQPTIGIDFLSKSIELDGQNVKIQIWDTAGQEKFKSLIPSYIRDSKAAVLCYDVTNFQSFQNIQTWINCVIDNKKDIIQVLLANKIDQKQDRVVSEEVGSQFAFDHNMLYYECSVEDGVGVTKMIFEIGIKLLGHALSS